MNMKCEVSAIMTNPILAEAPGMELARRGLEGDCDVFEALATRDKRLVYSLASNAGEKP